MANEQRTTMHGLTDCTECQGKDEYIKALQKALKEVLEQNETLKNRVIELEALVSQAADDVSTKGELILQLKGVLSQIDENEITREQITSILNNEKET